jgi:hypothetical protein
MAIVTYEVGAYQALLISGYGGAGCALRSRISKKNSFWFVQIVTKPEHSSAKRAVNRSTNATAL